MVTKAKTFKSVHEGAIAVSVPGRGETISFVPGEVRTYETDDPAEIAALRANPDLEEVKASKKK